MSCSMCIKCECMVGAYEKYCPDCVKKYGVKQDNDWHKTHWFKDWDKDRKIEFMKDLPEAIKSDCRKRPIDRSNK